MFKIRSIDTETALIEPGILAPDIACLSWASSEGSGILGRSDLVSFFRRDLEDPAVLLVLHNGAFDMAVLARFAPSLLPLIFEKYDQGLIHDTLIQEKLFDIRSGNLGWDSAQNIKKKYSLGSLVGGLDKDTWRLRYGELISVPVADWPQGAIDYAIHDAEATRELYLRQLEINGGSSVVDLEPQCRADFALQLMSVWGVRTDGLKVRAFEDGLSQEWGGLERSLKEIGFVRENGTRDLGAIRAHIQEVCPFPEKTEKGQISTSSAALSKINDASLKFLSRYCEIQKLFSTYLPALKQGVDLPINASYNILLKSGRTSCFSPNLQNLPRAPGVRECFVPRPGYYYCSVDYDSIELRALAEVLFNLVGGRTLFDFYNEDPHFDPHTRFACQILGIPFSEGLKRKAAGDSNLKKIRQMSKAANFGFMAGMGSKKFLDYAQAGYGVSLSQSDAQGLKQRWFSFLPEMRAYFELISDLTLDNRGSITQLFSGRVRGGVSFTEGANGFMQGLAADGVKKSLWDTAKACYAQPSSPLFGARPVFFVHDEIILEVPIENASEMAFELSEVMCKSMSEFCPHIPITASPALMDCWLKDAEPVYSENGALQPWSPKKEAA